MKDKAYLPCACCDAPYSALAHAVVLQAMEDFCTGRLSKRAAMHFFRSSWCEMLCADLGLHPRRIWQWLCEEKEKRRRA